MVLRLGEQYLIRAEAKAEIGDPTAIDDLNKIRKRAGLAVYSGAIDKTSILNAIAHERRIELFSEGQRWFDLKRTNKVDAVMAIATPKKSNNSNAWKPNLALFPIPLTDINAAPNLKQNPGY